MFQYEENYHKVTDYLEKNPGTTKTQAFKLLGIHASQYHRGRQAALNGIVDTVSDLVAPPKEDVPPKRVKRKYTPKMQTIEIPQTSNKIVALYGTSHEVIESLKLLMG